jgi:hypothetical protein
MDDTNHPEHTKAVNNEPGFTLDDYVQKAIGELMKQGWRKPVDSMTDYEKSWNTDRNLMPDPTSLSIPSKPIAGDMTGSESGYQRRVSFRRSQKSKPSQVKPKESGEDMMGSPDTKQVTSSTSAAFTGVMPTQNSPKSAPTKKPIATLTSGGTMTAPPPPPSPKANIISMDKKMSKPKRTGSSSSGGREIEHFSSSQQNESRMMNILIYGLMGVG